MEKMRKQPIVIARTQAQAEAAAALAASLKIEYLGVAAETVSGAPEEESGETVLSLGTDGLSLCSADVARDSRGNLRCLVHASLRADLTAMLPRLSERNLARELLVKATRVKGDRGSMTAVDATAGFGEDALLLAAAGFRVRMYECNPYIAALLADALTRASEIAGLAPLTARMDLVCGDSIPALAAMTPPDVVYLDPMFPKRTKSAAVGKKFQLLHRLEAPCPNEEELLRAALAARPRRVVIKRPVKGAYLAGVKPSFSVSGKAVRYDGIDAASFREDSVPVGTPRG